MKIIELFVPLDVTPEMEDIGLDKAEHGEKAYDLEAPEDDVEEEIMIAKLCGAAATGDVDLCKKLVKMGVGPGQGDVDGRTALHLAAAQGQLEVAKALVHEMGVDVNAEDQWGNTPLRDATRFHRVEIIDFLKANGAKLNKSSDDIAQLLNAASNGDAQALNSLLSAGADANATDYDGRSALHLAACGGHANAAALLIQHGASPTAVDRWGGLAIHDAQRYHHKAVIDIIKGSVGVDFKFDGPVGASPSEVAVTTASIRECLAAAKQGDLAELRRLKKKRVNLFSCDYDGRTALHVAAGAGHLECVKYLLTDRSCNVRTSLSTVPCLDGW